MLSSILIKSIWLSFIVRIQLRGITNGNTSFVKEIFIVSSISESSEQSESVLFRLSLLIISHFLPFCKFWSLFSSNLIMIDWLSFVFLVKYLFNIFWSPSSKSIIKFSIFFNNCLWWLIGSDFQIFKSLSTSLIP